MLDILFEIVFPLVLLGLLLIIFISGIIKKKPERQFMTFHEFIKDWLSDHGQAHKLDEQFEQMKGDIAGKMYMPITYKGAKMFIKLGLSPNKVSIMNLIFSFLTFYAVIMLGRGHNLDLLSQQPFYGSWFIPLAFFVLFTGIIDGIDGSIARLLDIKSKSGAWFDNVIDRISDTLLLVCFIPTSFMILPVNGSQLDFRWMVWTNILLIFIYEYMRARHEGLGLHETKPYIGERITRFLIFFTFFLIYGVSSFAVLISYSIDPYGAIKWTNSHSWLTTWTMLILQISLLIIMALSAILFARYIWKNLKKMDNIKIE